MSDYAICTMTDRTSAGDVLGHRCLVYTINHAQAAELRRFHPVTISDVIFDTGWHDNEDDALMVAARHVRFLQENDDGP